MENLINAFLNTILVSIPEETFLVAMTLILLKRFDLLDMRMWRQNLKWIMIPVLSTAISINLLRYFTNVQKPTISMMSMLIFSVIMFYILKNNTYDYNKRYATKILICLFVSFCILIISETIFTPIMLFLTKKGIDFYKDDIILSFIYALPSRIFEYGILYYFIIKSNSIVKINVIDFIIRNKTLRNSTILVTLFIITSMIYIIKLIGVDSILNNLTFLEQLFICLLVLVTPITLLFFLWSIIYYIMTKEKQIRQSYENLIVKDDISFDIEDDI